MSAAEPLPLAPDDLPPEAQAWVDTPDEALPPPPPPPDPRDLARYAGARARVEREIVEVQAQAQAHIDQAILWRDARVKALRGQAGRIDLFLLAIYEQHRALSPKTKTLSAPYGVTIQQRATPERYVCEAKGAAADEALVAYLNENDLSAYVRIKREPAWSDLTKDLRHTADGVPVDPNGSPLPPALGIEYQPATDGTPEVKVKAGA